MKIVALCGSPRKNNSRTGQLLKEVLAGAQSVGADTEYIDLTGLKLNYCLGCDRCHHLGECVQKDDFNSLFDKILSVDGLVLGSPVYIYHVTAQFKTWADRLGNAIHCQRLLGKYGAVVSTAGGSGQDETADYLELLLKRLGAQSVGRVACVLDDGPIPADAEPLGQARALGVTLARAIEEKKEFPEQLREQEGLRKYFRNVIIKRRDRWDWEYRYWLEKGWL
ncbi:iron-sulfur protein [Desulfofundulus thermobenzoicus]|uniref:Iron-sulfur protein n=1 Tax=Desulfofundulus thermobenzoicus TaxID=29376 RepID=A0A6N7IM17_9FIRM|nr:flavodoxin family protein [Desulfofundulus thermobenzoicus]MQL50991.1 iron-sulfur protein [Desulfofundulus thermobenzoicus]HHW43472.1 flavodoxin family protein [Desulfotomaculum sp.]